MFRADDLPGIYNRTGYGWLWRGPKVEIVETPSVRAQGQYTLDDLESLPEVPAATAQMSNPEPKPKPAPSYYYDSESVPDPSLIGLRLVAATAIAGAAFLIAGVRTKSATLS